MLETHLVVNIKTVVLRAAGDVVSIGGQAHKILLINVT
jgi:hypothetical protein